MLKPSSFLASPQKPGSFHPLLISTNARQVLLYLFPGPSHLQFIGLAEIQTQSRSIPSFRQKLGQHLCFRKNTLDNPLSNRNLTLTIIKRHQKSTSKVG